MRCGCLRRDEMLFAACLQLGGLADVRRGLELSVAASRRPACGTRSTRPKAGASGQRLRARRARHGQARRSRVHVSLRSRRDLPVPRRACPTRSRPSRIAQRLISYVSTMTGAGYAYQVDSRLRPSGQQGSLVTTHEAFARYQTEQAATWEHLALLRARAVAGDVERAQTTLDATRERIVREASNPWPYVADMRAPRDRGARRRGREEGRTEGRPRRNHGRRVPGGGCAARARRCSSAAPRCPRCPRCCARPPAARASTRCSRTTPSCVASSRARAGSRDARSRRCRSQGETAELVADLVRPGQSARELAARVAAARARIAAAFERVCAKGSVDALSA